MTKEERLNMLAREMASDTALPFYGQANLVFGEGNPESAVLFIGEAPGFHEDRLVRPFVGLSGKLLDKLIASVGWNRESVYITNIVKRRPPENRDPLPEEIAAYKPFLARQIEIIAPKAIVPLGRFSMNYFLPEARISRDQGKVFIVDGMKIIPMFHPAAALRAGDVMAALQKSFAQLPALIEGIRSPSAGTLPAASPSSRREQTLFDSI